DLHVDRDGFDALERHRTDARNHTLSNQGSRNQASFHLVCPAKRKHKAAMRARTITEHRCDIQPAKVSSRNAQAVWVASMSSKGVAAGSGAQTLVSPIE
ncbi:MAG: hypothetical protein M9944_18060, partial [Rhizobiaceae bacterium]|nr:hypothetical protein [Rhizobiaceae bacterium]